MPAILRKLPFFDERTTARIPGGPAIDIKHHQIVVWVSISLPGFPEFPPEARRFPAVLDTGFNDSFLIQERQFHEWTGLFISDFQQLDSLKTPGEIIPVYDADLWIHSNLPGHRDQLLAQPPFRLQLDGGIGISLNRPRLPLLGLQTLQQNHLEMYLDGEQCQVWMRSKRRIWFFGW